MYRDTLYLLHEVRSVLAPDDRLDGSHFFLIR